MTLPILAWTWSGAIGGLLGVVVFFVSILMVVLILVQESKDGGLSGAFGGVGGGGSALFGASMQKDLAKFTAFLAIVFAVSILIMGILSSGEGSDSIAAGNPTPALSAPESPDDSAPESPDDSAPGTPDDPAPGTPNDSAPGTPEDAAAAIEGATGAGGAGAAPAGGAAATDSTTTEIPLVVPPTEGSAETPKPEDN